jgi:hypothetical protein
VTASSGGWFDVGLQFDEGDFMDLVGFSKYGSDPALGNDGVGQFNSNNSVSFYYTRDTYNILFNDGIYVDGDGVEIDNRYTQELGLSRDLAYGGDISSFNKGGDDYYDPKESTEGYTPYGAFDPDGYVFAGWYLDSEGVTK